MILLFISLIFFKVTTVKANFPFESCNDDGSTYKGNCTVIENDGAIGAESVNTIWIKGGYLDYGPWWGGCPYKNNTCPNGFSYYGWIKFKAYPTTCIEYGVIVSTEVFNIHILGNGHLAVYAWLPNGIEYYAETVEPMMLDIYYPIIVQFQYFSNNNTWQLVVIVQSQLLAGAISGRSRTYTPPSSNLLFGGNGNGSISHSASVQLDRTTLDNQPQQYDYIYQVLLDVFARQSYCYNKYGILTQSLSCYWVETGLLNWTSAYSACSSYAYNAGYPYARLARFPAWNTSVWSSFVHRMAEYGNGSSSGYNAWIGGGHQFQWLNGSMDPVGAAVLEPPGVTYNNSTSTNTTCMQVITKSLPWQWSETTCSTTQRYVCEMSWDCLVINPCKNLGVCQPVNDGDNICKCWPGTSGRFCEIGFPTVNCINNCTCGNSLIPFDSCSICGNGLNKLLKLIKLSTLTSKTIMINMDIDYSDVEIWECSLVAQFQNVSNFLQNQSQLSSLSCDISMGLYVNVIIQKFIAKKFLQKFPQDLPSNITDLLHEINVTEQSVKNLSCFTNLTIYFKNTAFYNQFKQFYNSIVQQFNTTACGHSTNPSSSSNLIFPLSNSFSSFSTSSSNLSVPSSCSTSSTSAFSLLAVLDESF